MKLKTHDCILFVTIKEYGLDVEVVAQAAWISAAVAMC